MKKHSFLTRWFILLVAILMAALPGMQASAAMVKCRTDPIFRLSNGDKLVVVLEVSARPARIGEFLYILHLPPGVSVTKVTYTAKGFGIKERYEVVQDGEPRTYTSDVLVTLKNINAQPVKVVAHQSIKSKVRETTKNYNFAVGVSGQFFAVTVRY